MPRRVPKKRSYDVVFVASVVDAAQFQRREIDKIRSALTRAPSPKFLKAFGVILATYNLHQIDVTRSTAASMRRRIKTVLDAGKALQWALSNLTLTDIGIFNEFWTSQFLQNRKRISLSVFEENLPQFLVMAEAALGQIEAEPMAGAMPAFAKASLASGVCQVLFEETGKQPSTRKGDSFDRLLRFALKYADRTERRDVADLMRIALKSGPISGQRLLDLLGGGRDAGRK